MYLLTYLTTICRTNSFLTYLSTYNSFFTIFTSGQFIVCVNSPAAQTPVIYVFNFFVTENILGTYYTYWELIVLLLGTFCTNWQQKHVIRAHEYECHLCLQFVFKFLCQKTGSNKFHFLGNI
jgi:hypothetical protein